MQKHMQMWSRGAAVVQTKCQNGEEIWSKWLWPWNDCWCQTGWFEYLRNCWSQCGPFHAQWSLEQTSSEQQFCEHKCIVIERSQSRSARLAKANRKVTVMQITTHYNRGMQKISDLLWTHDTANLQKTKRSKNKSNKYLIKCSLCIYLRYAVKCNVFGQSHNFLQWIWVEPVNYWCKVNCNDAEQPIVHLILLPQNGVIMYKKGCNSKGVFLYGCKHHVNKIKADGLHFKIIFIVSF